MRGAGEGRVGDEIQVRASLGGGGGGTRFSSAALSCETATRWKKGDPVGGGAVNDSLGGGGVNGQRCCPPVQRPIKDDAVS